MICPIGENYERFARNLLAGQGGIARHAGLFSGQEIWAGLVAGPDPVSQFDNLDPAVVAALDRTARLAASAVAEALAD
ncbi:MAG TPA: hypothetical protein DCQ84_00100, partial [Candidatus Competibacteraceae bacterium]|nr:hypothetical protein [Candidatus Competibacteraceae bacterium]